MSFTGTYNILTDFAAFPCAQPNPIIIAITLVPAIAPALIDYAGLTCRDILKARLGHQAPCGRALKGQMAKAIPPAFQGTAKNLLKFEATFSKAGNAFLIADLVSDTLARWTTLAYQLSECPDALEGAAWQIKSVSAGAMNAGVPVAVGGQITHETGHPGIAWPNGGIIPAGWHFSAQFSIKAKALASNEPVGITIWLEQITGGHYDYPGHYSPPGYPGSETFASHYQRVHAPDRGGPTQYVFTAMADTLALNYDFEATCQATPFDQADWALEPLACFKDLLNPPHVNPAGRNRQSKFSPLAKAFAKAAGPPVPRGPPKGKPRSKK